MKSVLLVDHDKWVLDMYARSLQSEGVAVFKAHSAQEAVDTLDQNEIELVITDVQLPGHNGIEVVHEIRSYDDWHGIPIVIMSSIAPQSFGMSMEQWREYGVEMFLYKPEVPPAKLFDQIKDFSKSQK